MKLKIPIALWLAQGALPLLAQGTGTPAATFFLLTQQARTAFTVEGAGARAMGMGGAFTAIADDATAVSYNPAGLAQLLRPEVSVVVQGFSRNLDFTGFSGTSPGSTTAFENTTNQDRNVSLSFASFAVPWRIDGRSYVFLLSYQKVFDFTYNSVVDYLASANGGDTYQDIAQQVHQTGGFDQYSAAMGVELSHHLLLGLALNSWQGRSAFGSYSQRTTTGVDFLFDSDLAQQSTFHGFNATAGFIWRSKWLNLGMTYRSPFRASYVFANTTTTADPSTGAPTVTASGATTCELNWPETWAGGLGLHLGPRLLVTADWSFTPWSHTRFSGTGTSLDGLNWFDLQQNSVTPKATDQRMGVEWLASVRPDRVIPLRAGLFREPQPIVDPLTGAQRVLEGWTLGTGIKLKDFALDLALKATHDQRYISRYNTDQPIGGIAATAYGYEHLTEYRVYLSGIYQFQTEPVHRALAWIVE